MTHLDDSVGKVYHILSRTVGRSVAVVGAIVADVKGGEAGLRIKSAIRRRSPLITARLTLTACLLNSCCQKTQFGWPWLTQYLCMYCSKSYRPKYPSVGVVMSPPLKGGITAPAFVLLGDGCGSYLEPN